MSRNALFFLGAVFVLAGCALTGTGCKSPGDSPDLKYSKGMELIDGYRLEDASAVFEKAVYCNADHGPAYAGMAIISAYRVEGLSGSPRKEEFENALRYLRLAYKNADTNENEFAYRIASMRVYTALKRPPGEWINEAEDDYKNAMKLVLDQDKLLYYGGRQAAAYFMGMAYLEAGEFQAARDRFGDALREKRDFRQSASAEKEWKRTDKIVKAAGGRAIGEAGREIARKDAVKRGDMAALLASELKLERLFAERPAKSRPENPGSGPVPDDVAGVPFRKEVLSFIKWDIKGLAPVFDGTARSYLFRPGEALTRKDLALALEDLFVKISADEKAAAIFPGDKKTPYPDVPPGSALYDAVMDVTARKMMGPGSSGEFRPEGTVDGAEAIAAVMALKESLGAY